VRTHTRKMGEIAPGCQIVFCFSFVIKATGLSATYPPTISSIFETTDMNRFPHAYTGKKFFQFLHSGFSGPKTNGVRDRAAAQTAHVGRGRRESFWGLVDIPIRMCLLFVSLSGDVYGFRRYNPTKSPNFRDFLYLS